MGKIQPAAGLQPDLVQRSRIGVVIPCFQVRDHILSLLAGIGDLVETIYVVDDCCPEGSGRLVESQTRDSRVRVIFHAVNQGVGGAVLSGIEAALRDGMDVVVKIDGDGQMDPALLPLFVRPILAGEADVTKGNRFYDPQDVKNMPAVRLIGNAALSFLAKLATGYWNLFDPTNGYIAADARLLAVLQRDKLDKRYFFESDFLFRIGLLHAKVMDIPMAAIYGSQKSNLRIHREAVPFFVRNIRNFGKRLFYNYFLRDFNVASLEILFGVILVLFGTIYGIAHWGVDRAATAGTVMIAALPLLTGIVLLLSFINFDVQQIPRETISSRLPVNRQRNSPASKGRAEA
jgi:glycosyltransferase involved in cell wall biosynthesis